MRAKEITLCGMFAALIAVGAFLKINIPLPLYTMHFTLQWFFVLMAGYLLGGKLGGTSVAVYLLIGLAGVPIFAAGGGPAYILRPTFGFLFGFFPAAVLIGVLTKKMAAKTVGRLIIPGTVGLFVYYFLGMVYFYIMNNFIRMTPVGIGVVIVDYCLITLFPDFLLVVFAALFAAKLLPVFRSMFGE